MVERLSQDLRTPIKPAYATDNGNANVGLYDGKMKLTQGPVEIMGSGNVRLEWFPYPRLRFNFQPALKIARRLELQGGTLGLLRSGRSVPMTVDTPGCYIGEEVEDVPWAESKGNIKQPGLS
jgi:hypothetical protein